MIESNAQPLADDRPFNRLYVRLIAVAATILIGSLALGPFVAMKLDVFHFWIPWALATHGGSNPWAMYHIRDAGFTCDYPPVVPYFLAGADWVRSHFRWKSAGPGMIALIKLPSILSHVGGSIACYFGLRRIILPPRAATAGVLYAFSLPLLINSAWWGQYDALLSLPMLGAVLLLLNRRPGWAGACFGVAIGVKLQAIVILPVLVVFALRSDSTRRTPCLAAVGKAAAVAVLAWTLIAAPVIAGGAGAGVRRAYVGAVDKYPKLSINAFNTWQLLYQYRRILRHQPDAAASNDARVSAVHLTDKRIGLIAFAGYIALICGLLWRRPTRYNFAVAAVLCCFGFFMLPTQIHERYLVPAVALAVPLAVMGDALLYAGLFAIASVNQAWWIPLSNRAYDHLPISPAIARANEMLLVVFSTVSVILFLWATARFVRGSSHHGALPSV